MDLPSPAATSLRHRAGELRHFAAALERAAVFDLERAPDAADSHRMRLCRRILACNLRQLLVAADDLRETAWGFETRAALLEAGQRPRGAD
jgi:hypothetical protein